MLLLVLFFLNNKKQLHKVKIVLNDVMANITHHDRWIGGGLKTFEITNIQETIPVYLASKMWFILSDICTVFMKCMSILQVVILIVAYDKIIESQLLNYFCD